MELCVLGVLWRVVSAAVFCPLHYALVVKSEPSLIPLWYNSWKMVDYGSR